MQPVNGAAPSVYIEQVDTIFRQMPTAFVVNFVNAALTTTVLMPHSTRPFALPWFACVTLVTAGRLALWLRYKRTPISRKNVRYWAQVATAGSLLTGLSWGIGAAILFPVVPALGKIFLTMVIGGMCAGAVVVSSTHIPTFLAFLFSATLPLALSFLVSGTSSDAVLGMMTVIFAAALGVAGRQLNRTFSETILLRVDLNEANRRLRAEVAEHQRTEAALRQAQKFETIGQLTGGIAHDFNNLMTVIVGNLELAITRIDESSREARYVRAARHAAARGVSLIQRLLAFARKQNLDPQPLHLGRLLYGLEPLVHQLLNPNVSLIISIDPDLALAYVDANQIELALFNLVRNASDALPEGGLVNIAVRNCRDCHKLPADLTPGDYVVISVADNGTGMDQDTLSKVFDPFFTTKPVGSGTGLGLSMVQGFAVQSGGTVTIRSEVGEGTTVDLWLRQAKGLVEDGQRQQPEGRVVQGGGHILLCDDDDDVRNLLAEFLESAGYSVHAANSGAEVIGALDHGTDIDLLIVDYAMPGLNGLETIKEARGRRPGLRSLLITGHARLAEDQVAGIPLLRKPFTPNALAQKAAEILAAI